MANRTVEHMSNEQAVYEELKRALLDKVEEGTNLFFEYPGFIRLVALDESEWHIGTANGSWSGENIDGSGREADAFDTYLRADAPATVVVGALLKELEARGAQHVEYDGGTR
jgi:hypothetical protein